MKTIILNTILLLAVVLTGCATTPAPATVTADSPVVPDYEVVTCGTREFISEKTGFSSKILLEVSNFGGNEIQVAEMSLPVGYQGKVHPHSSIEIFYVLEGLLGHVVNGKGRVLKKGEVGVVRLGDTVVHSTGGDTPARVLVMWLPGGEIPPPKESDKTPWKKISCQD